MLPSCRESEKATRRGCFGVDVNVDVSLASMLTVVHAARGLITGFRIDRGLDRGSEVPCSEVVDNDTENCAEGFCSTDTVAERTPTEAVRDNPAAEFRDKTMLGSFDRSVDPPSTRESAPALAALNLGSM